MRFIGRDKLFKVTNMLIILDPFFFFCRFTILPSVRSFYVECALDYIYTSIKMQIKSGPEGLVINISASLDLCRRLTVRGREQRMVDIFRQRNMFYFLFFLSLKKKTIPSVRSLPRRTYYDTNIR